MEWVETTAKSVDEAKDMALDQLGVAADEAEFDVVEEPRSGLFGRTRGEARVRARVMPTAVRPKQERRQRGRNQKRDGAKKSGGSGSRDTSSSNGSDDNSSNATESSHADESSAPAKQRESSNKPRSERSKSSKPKQSKENKRMDTERQQSDVTPQEVGEAAATFMSDLAVAFGVDDASTDLTVDGTDLEVRLSGSDLGLMVGPGGRTLNAVQDLVRVSAQRRLGDHETRLRIDVGGYREKRRAALETFTASVAAKVIETGESKALEPMPSNDRKAVHDAVIEIDGVTSRSDGDDPMRRVVISPE